MLTPRRTGILFCLALLAACSKPDKDPTTTVELVTFEPVQVEGQEGLILAVQKKPTLAYLEVIERSPNVKSVTRVTNSEDKTWQVGPPVLSPVEDKLVYRVYFEEPNGKKFSSLKLQKVGSFARTRLTYGKWRDAFPAFTPDGKYVIFASDRTSTRPGLWRIKIGGGSGITMITQTMAVDYGPCVAPNGTTIAYTSLPPNAVEEQVWTVEMGTGLQTQLREGSFPQISPDGNKILYHRKDSESGVRQIWVMNIDGGEETQLTQNSEYDATDARWSPDGKSIVFASNEGLDSEKRRNFDIWLMAVNGSRKTQLTTNGSLDDHPCFSHDGRSIYFRSNRGGYWNVWRLDPVLP